MRRSAMKAAGDARGSQDHLHGDDGGHRQGPRGRDSPDREPRLRTQGVHRQVGSHGRRRQPPDRDLHPSRPRRCASQPREVLLSLGSVERNVVDSQDVTEEYVDVEARIKNFKEQEDKLNELLKEKRKEEKLEDIIKVSDRIARCAGRRARAGAAQLPAQHDHALDDQPHAARDQGLQAAHRADVRNRVTRRFATSWEALVDFGQEVALVAVGAGAVAPAADTGGVRPRVGLRTLPAAQAGCHDPGSVRPRPAPAECRCGRDTGDAVEPTSPCRTRPSTPRTTPSGSLRGVSRSTRSACPRTLEVQHVLVQVGEPDGERVERVELLEQRLADLACIVPGHRAYSRQRRVGSSFVGVRALQGLPDDLVHAQWSRAGWWRGRSASRAC